MSGQTLQASSFYLIGQEVELRAGSFTNIIELISEGFNISNFSNLLKTSRDHLTVIFVRPAYIFLWTTRGLDFATFSNVDNRRTTRTRTYLSLSGIPEQNLSMYLLIFYTDEWRDTWNPEIQENVREKMRRDFFTFQARRFHRNCKKKLLE